MEAQIVTTPEGHDDELARVVARIRATKVGLSVSTPSADAIESVIAHLQGEELLGEADLAEHEHLWREVQNEMRRRDQANDRAEGFL